jgi:cobalt-precorrin 5A hydrolase
VNQSIGIWLVRPEAEHIGQSLAETIQATVYRPWENSCQSQKEQFAKVYHQHSAWILVMATGIAVRFVDGLIKDKTSDPAVVVVDEGGCYAVVLLGGHEAGANQLAFQIANSLGAVPVVTTATEALKPLVVGIGFRKGSTAEQIHQAVCNALGDRELGEVRELVTVDIKAQEQGLVEFCASNGLPLRSFKQTQIAQRSWVTKPSDFVKEAVGLDGVCEPCALIASPRGRLIVPKTAFNGVAVAVVEDTIKTRKTELE